MLSLEVSPGSPAVHGYRRPTLWYNFRLPGGSSISDVALVGPAPTTYTRSSAAMAFDENGVLQQYGIDIPAFDHDPYTGEALGLLIEPARAMRALWNRDLTNAVWVKTNCTSALDETGLKGDANACSTLTATGANATCLQTVTFASNDVFYSAWVKRKTGTGDIQMTADGGATWTTLTDLSSSVFKRYVVNQTLANAVIGFRIVTSGDEIIVDFNQHEVNVPNATSLRVTNAASVTRQATALYLINEMDWYNNSGPGTIYSSMRHYADDGTHRYVFDITNNSTDTRNSHRIINPDRNWVYRQSATVEATITGTSGFPAYGVVDKMASAWDVNDGVFVANGSVIGTDNSMIMHTDASRMLMAIRQGGGADYFYGWFGEIIYWPYRLPTAALQAMTT